MNTAAPRTKQLARKLAARQLRFGYYAAGGSSVYIFCPECRAKVTAEYLPWDKPTPVLLKQLTEHLVGCGVSAP